MIASRKTRPPVSGLPTDGRLDAKTVAISLGLFWLIFLTLYTLRSLVLGTPHQWAALTRRTAVACVGISLAWLMYLVLTWLRPAKPATTVAYVGALSVPAAALYALANFLLFDVIAPMPGDVAFDGTNASPHEVISGITELTINWSFVYAAWGLLYLSLATAERTRQADLRANAHMESARLAEIRALRYQVNPHFLFNLLNSLAALVSRRDTHEAEALIGEMGRFFRFSLATDPVADIALSEEIEMQTRYLELERRRFPERLKIEVSVDDTLAAAAVPSLILQPLVENAVKHGVARSIDPVTICIGASLTPDGRLSVIVEDDAVAKPTTMPVAGTGTGLKNVSDRLAARFGAASTCVAGPGPTRGFRVVLTMPLVTEPL